MQGGGRRLSVALGLFVTVGSLCVGAWWAGGGFAVRHGRVDTGGSCRRQSLPLPIKTIFPGEAWEAIGFCAAWGAAAWGMSTSPISSRWGGRWR